MTCGDAPGGVTRNPLGAASRETHVDVRERFDSRFLRQQQPTARASAWPAFGSRNGIEHDAPNNSAMWASKTAGPNELDVPAPS